MAKPIMLVDMEMSDEDKLEEVAPITRDVPDYPWGLRICLTHKELAKLNLDPSAAFVGATIHGHFMAEITSISSTQIDGDECNRIELQITSLAIESEDEEDAEPETVQPPKKGMRSLYGSSH